jgi:hemolysin III
MRSPRSGARRDEAPSPDLVPRLRGVLHAATFPLAIAAGIVLIVLAPTALAKLAAAVYAFASALLFGVSAAYHRRIFAGRGHDVLHRLDHADIYLIIAGTYTPLALLALRGDARVVVLAVIWTGAAVGAAFRVAWPRAPRWLYTGLYVVLGWTAVFVLPQLLRGAGAAALILVLSGGIAYSLGGLVYGTRRPDPSPRWFGFHEVFHALTVVAYILQYVAVSLVIYRAT